MSLSRPLQGTAGLVLKGLKGAEFSSVVVLRAQVGLGGSQGPALLSERPEPGCLGSALRWAQARLAAPRALDSPAGIGLTGSCLWVHEAGSAAGFSEAVGPGSLACRTRGWAGPAVSGYGPRAPPTSVGKVPCVRWLLEL